MIDVQRRSLELFHQKYEINNETGCWLWTDSLLHNGYGRFSIKAKSIRAHRLSYLIFIGEIPKGMLIAHACDNRSCVNPKHLFLASPKDNSRDMVSKGRSAKGEKHSQSKLNENLVIDIRKKLNSGINASRLSKDLNISRLTITDIKLNKTWKHIL